MRALGRVSVAGVLLCLAVAAPAAADGPGLGTPTVVTLGDSAISGEAGRWAGNTNMAAWRSTRSAERLRRRGQRRGDPRLPPLQGRAGAHRQRREEPQPRVLGAKTSTGGTASGENFKPGIDFYTGPKGVGQALALQEYARTNNVKAVVVMIGANNYGFAAIVERCVTNWVTSPSWWKNYCSDDSDMTSRFTSTRIAAETANVRAALQRVSQAMGNAGYDASQYTILAQTYWSPIPRGPQNPLPRERLDAPVRRGLRRVEPRPQLGQRHRRARR